MGSNDSYITVVGAVNIDICGTSNEQLMLYDSNPGKSYISYGGVGRNIAENLCRLGEKVELITVLGDDPYVEELTSFSEGIGISFKHSMRLSGAHTSTYISINNSDGDMSLAVSDMTIYDEMPVDFIAEKMDVLNNSKLVIIDTNMSQQVIEYIANNCTVPIMADPVSTKKSVKLLNVLDRLYMIKPNIFEAELLAGMKIDSNDDIKDAAKFFVDRGIKIAFISEGSDGAYYNDGEHSGLCPCAKGRIVNTNGCGDAFVAAVAWVFIHGGGVEEMAKAGVAASAICAESESTISDDLNIENLRKRMA